MGDINYRPLIEDMTFSYSRLNSYHSCPYRWKLHYLDGYKPGAQFYSSFGSLMHSILEKYYRGKLRRSEMSSEFLIRFSDEVKGLRPSAKVVESYISAALKYFQSFEELDLKILGVEQQVFFEVNGIRMTGIIDLIGEKDGNIIIVDHKSHELKQRSGRAKPTIKDKELDEYLKQLYLYSTAIKDQYGKFPSELWFNCYRQGVIVKEPFDGNKYNKAVQWATETYEKICEDEDFEANYDYFYCRWICDHNFRCDVFEEEIG